MSLTAIPRNRIFTEVAVPPSETPRIWAELDKLREGLEKLFEKLENQQEKLENKMAEVARELRHNDNDNANTLGMALQEREVRTAKDLQDIRTKLDTDMRDIRSRLETVENSTKRFEHIEKRFEPVEELIKAQQAVDRWKQGKLAIAWTFMGTAIGVLIKWLVDHLGSGK